MNSLVVVLGLMIISFTSGAQQSDTNVDSVLMAIETKSIQAEFCVGIVLTNQLIRMGEPAVDVLIAALEGDKFGHVTKWSAALALGEIGNPKALSVLTQVAAANPPDTHNFYLGQLASRAAAKLEGKIPKEGKFRKMTIGLQTTITDCESGEVKVIK